MQELPPQLRSIGKNRLRSHHVSRNYPGCGCPISRVLREKWESQQPEVRDFDSDHVERPLLPLTLALASPVSGYPAVTRTGTAGLRNLPSSMAESLKRS